MNHIKNIHTLIILLVFASLIVIISVDGCANKDETQKTTDNNKQKDSTIKQVIYTCPMHPEVRSANKNDKCPKCGMNLVEVKEGADQKSHADKYSLKLAIDPPSPKAEQDVVLNFTLTNNETKGVIKDLEIVHEKILHLIIVSKNLAYFDHIHPIMNSDGSLSVKTKFKYGGDYVLFADLTPKGETKNQVFNLPLKVEGEPVPAQTLNPSNTFETEGYSATLATDPTELTINKSIEIVVNLKKDGKDVTDLQNYLGALGHMVVISEDALLYLHVHPMEAENKGAPDNKEMENMKMNSDKVTKSGPRVVFHTSFPRAGIYKVFAQFNPDGKLITTNFVVKVN